MLDLLGLGDIAQKIKGVITSIQDKFDPIIDKIIDAIIALARKLTGKGNKGGEEEAVKEAVQNVDPNAKRTGSRSGLSSIKGDGKDGANALSNTDSGEGSQDLQGQTGQQDGFNLLIGENSAGCLGKSNKRTHRNTGWRTSRPY